MPKALPEALPGLGLSDIVIFPGLVAPLLVDTAESIRLIDDVVEGGRLPALVLKMLKFPDNTVRVFFVSPWHPADG